MTPRKIEPEKKKAIHTVLRDNDKSTALNMFKLFSQFSPQVIRTK